MYVPKTLRFPIQTFKRFFLQNTYCAQLRSAAAYAETDGRALLRKRNLMRQSPTCTTLSYTTDHHQSVECN